jgi:hypothetical protein
MFTDDESVQFLKDETAKAKLANDKKLSDVNVKDYDAVFYPGGHGPVLDLPTDPVNIKLASEVTPELPFLKYRFVPKAGIQFYRQGKITAPFTGFSNAEEVAVSGVEVSCISEFTLNVIEMTTLTTSGSLPLVM